MQISSPSLGVRCVRRRKLLLRAEKLVDLCDYGGSFANSSGDPFGRAGASITDGKYAVDTGLQRERPDHAVIDIGSRQDESLAVQRNPA